MPQAIDPIKLKAAAEYLEWVLRQYPQSAEVQGLLRALTPLLEAAKTESVSHPLERWEVPGTYDFGDGLYFSFKNPNVEDAYVAFAVELRGGLSEQEARLYERIEGIRNSGVGGDSQ